jgi:GNAT superfamily N-acetyltransferase
MTRAERDLLFCDTDLARRIEQAEAATTRAYVAVAAALRPDDGCMSEPVGDGVAIFAGARSPLNRVLALGMSTAVEQAVLERCADLYAERGELPRIDLCPLADPSLLLALQQNRYTVTQFKHVFVRRLATWTDNERRPDGIDTAPIGAGEADLWAQTVANAFHGGDVDATNLAIALPNAHKEDTCCFLARIEGAVVGGGALALRDGVAICYSTSVLPAMRRLGVQQALLRARLGYAKAQGCDLAMAQTTPGNASQRNVERFGFQIAYTKATMLGALPG